MTNQQQRMNSISLKCAAPEFFDKDWRYVDDKGNSVICGAFVHAVLGSNPADITLTVSGEEFPGSSKSTLYVYKQVVVTKNPIDVSLIYDKLYTFIINSVVKWRIMRWCLNWVTIWPIKTIKFHWRITAC